MRKDDEAEGGRIATLARDVIDQYEMLTGEPVELFLDRDEIEWGDDWKQKIDDTLSSTAFFIPVITPRFFQSPECRREFNFFARRADALGVSDLVLPIYYVECPAIEDDSTDDDLATRINTYQRIDWRHLRFSDRASPEYRKAVSSMASRIAAANAAADRVMPAAPANSPALEPEDSPGLIDAVAGGEEALPKLNAVLSTLMASVQAIGAIMNTATAATKSAKTFVDRRRVLADVAGDLQEPVDAIWDASQDFTEHLHEIDQGYRAIIARAPSEISEDEDARMEYCRLFATIRDMATTQDKSLSALEGFLDNLSRLEQTSRSLRPVLKKLRAGLTNILEGRKVSAEWIRLLDESGVHCADYEIG